MFTSTIGLEKEMPSTPVIQTKALTKSYGAKLALNAVDLDIEAGGIIAILGRNGAGKTTLIHSLLGLVRAKSGSARVFSRRPGHALNRQATGVMLQDADLPESLTTREHAALYAEYYDRALDFETLSHLCELGEFEDRLYRKLSGGQKRRAQFAMAVIGQPELLFLDEPTTGLDPEARRAIWRVVRALAERGTTIILTTHYLEEADRLADRIIVMDGGQIKADAAADDIRSTVGGAVIRCVTTLDEAQRNALPGVEWSRQSGRLMEMLTRQTTDTLRALLDADPALEDLTVSRPSLEDIFLDLTERPELAAQGDAL